MIDPNKTCSVCLETKPKNEKFFYVIRVTDTGVKIWESRCKLCKNKYNRDYCKKLSHKIWERNHRKKFRIERAKWLDSLKHKPCMDCGKSFNPWVMDFHHRDPKSKVASVSMIAPRSISKSRILEEISKCDLICANCHRDREHKEKRSKYE